jgi:hypothetical protein
MKAIDTAGDFVSMRLWKRVLLCLIPVLFACSQSEPESGTGIEAEKAGDQTNLDAPFEVTARFEATLWGDMDTVALNAEFKESIRSDDEDDSCIQIQYRPGPKRWAGVYWQSRKDYGLRPDVEIKGAEKVSFWARGESGKEVVSFKAFGQPASTLLQKGKTVQLSQAWERYEVALSEDSPQKAKGVFGVNWSSTSSINPEGLVLYLDDIRYE